MNFRKLNIPKIHPRRLAWNPSFTELFDFPSCCSFFPDNDGSFATDHQPYAPTASLSYRVLLDSWKERHSLLISWYPEAQLSLFLLVKLLLLTSGCFSHPSLFTLFSFFLDASHSQFIPRFPSLASGQAVDLFVSLINVCLWRCVLNVWSCVLIR